MMMRESFVGGEREEEFFCVCEREREHGLFFSLLDPGFNSNEIMTEADATCYTRTVGGTYLLIVVLVHFIGALHRHGRDINRRLVEYSSR